MKLWEIVIYFLQHSTFIITQRHDGYYLDGICNFVVCRVSVKALRYRIIDGPSATSCRIPMRSSIWRFCSYYNFLIQKSINVNVNFKEICDKNFYFITMKKKMSLIFIPEYSTYSSSNSSIAIRCQEEGKISYSNKMTLFSFEMTQNDLLTMLFI